MKTSPYSLAFPVEFTDENDHGIEKRLWHNGLTKREYFASMAMQGIIATGQRVQVAQDAIKCADSLIDALNEEATSQETGGKG